MTTSRDCYWHGQVGTGGDAPKDPNNWIKADGTALGGYPGEFTVDYSHPTYNDRVYFLAGGPPGITPAKPVLQAMGSIPGPPIYALGGAYIDRAYYTAYSANPLKGLIALAGVVYIDADYQGLQATMLYAAGAGACSWDIHGNLELNLQACSPTVAWTFAIHGNPLITLPPALGSGAPHQVTYFMVNGVISNPKITGSNWCSWANYLIDQSVIDAVQPDVSRVLQGVVFGLTGHTKTGTLVVIGSGSASSRLGYECKLYRNAGSHAAPDWQEILPVKDVTLNLEKGEADATTRANDGWKAVRGALKSGSVDFEIVWDPTDEGFQALFDGYLNGTRIEFAIMDGLMVAPGAEGLRATMEVLKFPRSEPLEGLVAAAVTLKPTRADNAPEWLVVPE